MLSAGKIAVRKLFCPLEIAEQRPALQQTHFPTAHFVSLHLTSYLSKRSLYFCLYSFCDLHAIARPTLRCPYKRARAVSPCPHHLSLRCPAVAFDPHVETAAHRYSTAVSISENQLNKKKTMATSVAQKRLFHEYKNLSTSPPDGITAGPVSEDDMFVWEALIQGPEGTPFEGGVFAAELKFPKDYPLSPPSMRFLGGGVWHPNGKSESGSCAYILRHIWDSICCLASDI